jgi:nucleotide-binding universal stress UspA family protein
VKAVPQIKKILFPVDFSPSCVGAARYVEAWAGQFEAEIMLLHAVGMGEHSLPRDLMPVRQKQLDDFLASELKYFTTNRVCTEGEAAETIVEAVTSWKPDLVMMPTHGLGFYRRHLLGSVTAKVLHDLHCPVWTSVHAEFAPPLESVHCRKILCAVDFVESSRCILEWAAWLAGQYQASLGIVHANPTIDPDAGMWSLEEEFRRFAFEKSMRSVELLQAETGAKAAQVFVNPGRPAEVVCSVAKNFGADLVVIGRHNGAGIAGHLFQNAYSILRESPCPVVSI